MITFTVHIYNPKFKKLVEKCNNGHVLGIMTDQSLFFGQGVQDIYVQGD